MKKRKVETIRTKSRYLKMNGMKPKRIFLALQFLSGLLFIYVLGLLLNLTAGQTDLPDASRCSCDRLFFDPHDRFQLFYACLLGALGMSWIMKTINRSGLKAFTIIFGFYLLVLFAVSYDEIAASLLK